MIPLHEIPKNDLPLALNDSIGSEAKYSKLALLTLALISAIGATILAEKISSHYNPQAMSHFKLRVIEFQRSYPILPALCLAAFIAMGAFSLKLGLCMVPPLAAYAGMRFDLERQCRLQSSSSLETESLREKIVLS